MSLGAYPFPTRVNLLQIQRVDNEGCAGGFNMVLIIEPMGGPVYRREFSLLPGEEVVAWRVADAIRRVAKQITYIAQEREENNA